MKSSTIILLASLFVAVSAGPSVNLSVKTLSAETSPPSTGADNTPYQDEVQDEGNYTPSSNPICIDYDCVCGQIEELADELLDVPTDEDNMIDEDYLGELNDNPVCVQPSDDDEYDSASYSYCFYPGEIDRIQSENHEMGNLAVYDEIC